MCLSSLLSLFIFPFLSHRALFARVFFCFPFSFFLSSSLRPFLDRAPAPVLRARVGHFVLGCVGAQGGRRVGHYTCADHLQPRSHEPAVGLQRQHHAVPEVRAVVSSRISDALFCLSLHLNLCLWSSQNKVSCAQASSQINHRFPPSPGLADVGALAGNAGLPHSVAADAVADAER